ncbi:MAG: 3'-5' exoribonuclease YhaM family protein [Syntrophales bacterium]
MSHKNIFIRQIKAGDQVHDSFLVTEKNMTFSQKGSPYLSLRLRDRTGEIEGRIWDKANEYNVLFKKGDVIRIQSRAANFKSSLQLSITDVKKIDDSDIDPVDFCPASKSNIEEMFEELMAFIRQVENPCLRGLLEEFFRDEEIVRRFKSAPAAKAFHHVCIGGLLEHTLSVVRLLVQVAGHYEDVDRDLLIAGGILHDIGKIDELAYDRMIDYTDEGRLVGHIVIGVEMLDSKISRIEHFPKQLAMELRHILLSHHGSMEFGSPKRPKTLEALIIHYIDDLDAKVNAFQRHIEASDGEESDWTPFHRLFERFIYKGK